MAKVKTISIPEYYYDERNKLIEIPENFPYPLLLWKPIISGVFCDMICVDFVFYKTQNELLPEVLEISGNRAIINIRINKETKTKLREIGRSETMIKYYCSGVVTLKNNVNRKSLILLESVIFEENIELRDIVKNIKKWLQRKINIIYDFCFYKIF